MNRNCAIRPSRVVWGTCDIFSEFVLDLIDSQKEYRPNQVSWIFSKILMATDLLLMVGYFLLSCSYFESWWRHQMEKKSSLALCAGNSPVTGEFPSKRPVTRIFGVFFICARANIWVNNRNAGDLRRHRAHYDVIVMMFCRHIPALYSGRSRVSVTLATPNHAANSI